MNKQWNIRRLRKTKQDNGISEDQDKQKQKLKRISEDQDRQNKWTVNINR